MAIVDLPYSLFPISYFAVIGTFARSLLFRTINHSLFNRVDFCKLVQKFLNLTWREFEERARSLNSM